MTKQNKSEEVTSLADASTQQLILTYASALWSYESATRLIEVIQKSVKADKPNNALLGTTLSEACKCILGELPTYTNDESARHDPNKAKRLVSLLDVLLNNQHTQTAGVTQYLDIPFSHTHCQSLVQAGEQQRDHTNPTKDKAQRCIKKLRVLSLH